MGTKITSEIAAAFLALLIIFLVFVSGCSQRGVFPRGDKPGFDMSPEGRQQMFEQMRQQSIDACVGKMESDACIIERLEGRTMEGVCTMSDATLSCINNTMMHPMGDGTRPRGQENGA